MTVISVMMGVMATSSLPEMRAGYGIVLVDVSVAETVVLATSSLPEMRAGYEIGPVDVAAAETVVFRSQHEQIWFAHETAVKVFDSCDACLAAGLSEAKKKQHVSPAPVTV